MDNNSPCRNLRTLSPVLSSSMKAAELIESDYGLLPIFSRFGIRLGFGDVSVGELCGRYGISSELFLLICRIYSLRDYMPSDSGLCRSDLEGIMRYLHNSHAYYSEVAIPHLSADMNALMNSCDKTHHRVLARFFADYIAEVDNHFAYEESVVFPYVRAVLGGGSAATEYRIVTFEDNHGDIDEKLSDLKNIIIKYLPENCPDTIRYEVLSGILRLEEDLCKHTLVENNVLVPLVQKVERDAAR